MERLQKIDEEYQGNSLNNRENILKEEYNYNEAEDKLKEFVVMKNEIIENIDDVDYVINLFESLYKLSFQNLGKEEQSKHIMYRVLMGTNISEREQNVKFIFDDRDEEVLKVFDKCNEVFSSGINEEDEKIKIKEYVDKLLDKEGLLETIH